MFEINETVKHNKMGICFIKDITEFDDKKYYILYQNNNNTKIMIPVDNKNIIRKILTKDEVDSLIKSMPNIEVCSIFNFKDKNKEYERLLKSGEASDLLKLIKTLDEQQKENNNLNMAEKEKFTAAEKLLYEEFGIALDIEEDQVKKYILDTIK